MKSQGSAWLLAHSSKSTVLWAEKRRKEGKKEREGMSEGSNVGSGSVGTAPTSEALCTTKTFVLRALVAHSCPNSL